ncbi:MULTISPECIES: hypothetical protein [Chitinophagaceae]
MTIKNLDLNAMGLASLNEAERMETDGGLWQELVVGVALFLVQAAYEAGKNAYAYDKAHQ